MTTISRRAAALCCALAIAGVAHAATQPAQAAKLLAPGDTTDMLPVANNSRLVVFRYDPNRSFAIRALAGAFVNVELPEGETVQGYYVADPVNWGYHVTGDNRRVLIQPKQPGLVTTATLVGDKRSYELTLVSVAPGEPWMQRVQWQVPGAGMGDGLYWRGGQAAAPAGADAAPAALRLDPARLDFGYRMIGKARFAPAAVFSDGTRTYLRFDGVQDIPAIFAVRRDGQMEVLPWAVEGGYVVLPSVQDVMELRLGREALRVERKR